MRYSDKKLATDMKKASKDFEKEVRRIKTVCEHSIIDFDIDFIVEQMGERGEDYRPVLENIVNLASRRRRKPRP